MPEVSDDIHVEYLSNGAIFLDSSTNLFISKSTIAEIGGIAAIMNGGIIHIDSSCYFGSGGLYIEGIASISITRSTLGVPFIAELPELDKYGKD